MSDGLKPCPCCGSDIVMPIFVNVDTPHAAVAVMCKKCGLQTGFVKKFPKAKDCWNTRFEKMPKWKKVALMKFLDIEKAEGEHEG